MSIGADSTTAMPSVVVVVAVVVLVVTVDDALSDSVSAENAAFEGKFFPFLLPAAIVGRLIESCGVAKRLSK